MKASATIAAPAPQVQQIMREPVIMSPFASMAAELLDPEQRNLEFVSSKSSPKAPVKQPTSSPARKKAAKKGGKR